MSVLRVEIRTIVTVLPALCVVYAADVLVADVPEVRSLGLDYDRVVRHIFPVIIPNGPVAEMSYKQLLTLPLDAESDQERIVEVLRRAL